MDEQSLLDYLQLSFCDGIGPLTFQNLLGHFSHPGKVLRASDSELRSITGIGTKTIDAIRSSPSIRPRMKDQIKICQDADIRIIPLGTECYPHPLSHIPAAPPILFCQGNLSLFDCPWSTETAIALVGTRQATQYGLHTAANLTRQLVADGFITVSGLARGIDRQVHQTTLENQGTTIAILGSGLLRVYPGEHQGLAHQIRKQGLLISEVFPSESPHSRLFPRRNRIISGLTMGVIVIEAAIRSGALITARHAMEQNREVMAVPGLIDTPAAAGCHKLIKDGAQLVESVDDIYEALEHTLASRPAGFEQLQPLPNLSPEQQQIYDLVPHEVTSIDLLPRPDPYSMPQLLATLTALELKHLIRRPSGSTVQRIG